MPHRRNTGALNVDSWEPVVMITRREYLIRSALELGIPALYVNEAVYTTALAHPEWDLDDLVDPVTGEA